ncbi:hypothetical protein LIER_24221 [Lithospermum erythrorhizon]|uniref:Uncharacterized protein n=1 Tax=Lithospermum erythrorhizon TaxID=34254 RepID=A0AAV3R0I6_LITER
MVISILVLIANWGQIKRVTHFGKRSGWSDDGYISKGLELYQESEGKKFTLLEEWKLVRNQPRYSTGTNASESSGSKRKSSDDDEFSIPSSFVRPEGRYATKKKEQSRATTATTMLEYARVKKLEMLLTLKNKEERDAIDETTYNIIRQPARIWDIDVLGKIMRTCIILHNMIVEDERDTYSRNYENLDFEPSNNPRSSSSFNVQTQVHPQFQVHVEGRSESDIHSRAELRDRGQHIQLKKDLVDHICNKFGTPE